MNTIKSLLSISSNHKTIENATDGIFQTGVVGDFKSPSIVNIVVINKNVTEVIFKDTVRSYGKLAGEQQVSLMIENDKETDIVETFVGEELKEFYNANLQEVIRKAKVEKAITHFLLKTWKESVKDTEDHLMKSVRGEFIQLCFSSYSLYNIPKCMSVPQY